MGSRCKEKGSKVNENGSILYMVWRTDLGARRRGLGSKRRSLGAIRKGLDAIRSSLWSKRWGLVGEGV